MEDDPFLFGEDEFSRSVLNFGGGKFFAHVKVEDRQPHQIYSIFSAETVKRYVQDTKGS